MSVNEINYKGMTKEKHQETVVYGKIFEKRVHSTLLQPCTFMQVSRRDGLKTK